ncbi:MAG TPA: 50S ribosomal protein L29 [Vicinamibacterales bacterium]|nr:50S ribosomal protein L29 [Vicinamibacterales bacterium]
MTKAAEFRELSVTELRVREHELQDEMFRLRIKGAMGEIEAQNKLRGTRRSLARVKTLIREKGE